MHTFNHRSGESLTTEGADIYFEVLGDESQPPLLLLHGGMGTIEDFNEFASTLEDFRLVGIDARGHGKSTLGTKPLTYQQLAKDVCRVLDALSIARLRMIGFSDGGIIGYRLALYESARIDKLITIGASCRLTPATAAILGQVTAASWTAQFPATRPAYEQHNPQPDFEAFIEAAKRMWLDRTARGYPGQAVKGIDCHTLIIRGDDDPLFSLEEAVELRRLIEHSQLLNIPAAGHAAFIDGKDICVPAVQQFLRNYSDIDQPAGLHAMEGLRV